MKQALIIGSAGQDGSYLSEQLSADGWQVTGISRRIGQTLDLQDRAAVRSLVKHAACDAIFYLAAHHRSSEDAAEELAAELHEAHAVHVEGWVNCLEALRQERPDARAFYAASSHVFGEPAAKVSESTPFAPRSAYAITKAAGVEIGRLFRSRGLHVSSGYLFNHESPRRPARFVSQRITLGAIAAKRAITGNQPFALELGSLAAVVDWGYAPDYTRAMSRIVSRDVPGDYVIASGTPHTVADWCALAFEAVGLDWKQYVRERPGRVTRQVPPLIGDASFLMAHTGWAPTCDFEQMVRLMVRAADHES